MIYIAIATLSLGLILLGIYFIQRKSSGLPSGEVIYTDTSSWETVEKPLYDPVYHITGRPDYLVKLGKRIVPVELKSSRVKDKPYKGHIYQLAAYCHLVSASFNQRPEYGLLRYPTIRFKIEYCDELEDELKSTMDEMRALEQQNNVTRSHNIPARCIACGYVSLCEMSLK